MLRKPHMMNKLTLTTPIIILLALVSAPAVNAETTQVAVAANFTAAAKQIAKSFQQQSGHQVRFSFGATGQLFTQITQGAPFDVFLAADQRRPQLAEQQKLAVAGTRFTYALGKIVLFSMNPSLIKDGNSLKTMAFKKLAIANPITAPYGAAAKATLDALGLYPQVASRIVQGNNIAQTYQFVQSENADIGFVALSQIIAHNKGSRWIVPQQYYPALAQDAVLLNRGKKNVAALAFLDFLKSETAKAIIRQFGYDTEQ